LEDYGLAVIDAEAAIGLDPTYAKAHYRLGCAYVSMGKFQQAKKSFHKVFFLFFFFSFFFASKPNKIKFPMVFFDRICGLCFVVEVLLFCVFVFGLLVVVDFPL